MVVASYLSRCDCSMHFQSQLKTTAPEEFVVHIFGFCNQHELGARLIAKPVMDAFEWRRSDH
jgi:hypothetical protein